MCLGRYKLTTPYRSLKIISYEEVLWNCLGEVPWLVSSQGEVQVAEWKMKIPKSRRENVFLASQLGLSIPK